MANLESQLDAKTRAALMASCGRACARRNSVYGVASSSKGDPGKFVQTLAIFLGEDNAVLEKGIIRLTYPKILRAGRRRSGQASRRLPLLFTGMG